jgi:hypothetical protein
MCSDCDSKEYELIQLHKECARLITDNHFLNQRVDGLLADNNALRAANSGLHQAVVRGEQQHLDRHTGAM